MSRSVSLVPTESRPRRRYAFLALVCLGLLLALNAPGEAQAALIGCVGSAPTSDTSSLSADFRTQFPALQSELALSTDLRATHAVAGGQSVAGFASVINATLPAGKQPGTAQQGQKTGTTSLSTFYPANYCSPFVVQSAGVRVEVRADGGRAVQAQVEKGKVAYKNVYPQTDSLNLALPGQSKEFLLLHNAGAPTQFSYILSVSKGASASLENGAVVVKGPASKAARLQIPTPWLLDAKGQRHAGSSVIRWDLREQTNGTYLLLLVLNPAGLTYPLAIDPSWLGPQTMTAAREDFSLTLLADGRALAVGGFDGTNAMSSAEIYDPATGAWTAVAPMNTARRAHTTTLLKNGLVLVTGGYQMAPPTTVTPTGPSVTALASAEIFNPITNVWTPTASMQTARYDHTATLLGNGRVLVIGGSNGSSPLDSLEIFDPVSGTWTTGGQTLENPRLGHTATLLPDGTVLIAGGLGISSTDLDSAELFNPATLTFDIANASTMNVARVGHTATLLNDGTVLVVGSRDSSTNTAEVYDPTSHTWTLIAQGSSLHVGRYQQTATLLNDGVGRVLIAGGKSSSNNELASVEVYNPLTKSFSLTVSTSLPRFDAQAVSLIDGTVLIAGGEFEFSPMNTSEIYSLAGPPVWSFTPNPMVDNARNNPFTVTLLQDGRVLVAGGEGEIPTAEVYDPTTGVFSSTQQNMTNFRLSATATLLHDGRVLVAGGNAGSSLASTEFYDPIADTWTAGPNMSVARESHTATLLPDGRVLVVGGSNNGVSLSSSEIYDPATNIWTPAAALNTSRNNHTATLLPDGRILVTGGYNTNTTQTLDDGEIANPTVGTWTAITLTSMQNRRADHTATLLQNGTVLLAGGRDPFGESMPDTSDIFDPATNSFSPIASTLHFGRSSHAAQLLPNGKVAVMGGQNSSASFTNYSVELFDPTTQIWSLENAMSAARTNPGSVLMPNGTVLVIGGDAGGTAEIYNPSRPLWIATAPMQTARINPSATLLPNGIVIVAGGEDSDGNALQSAELYNPATNTWKPAPDMTTPRAVPDATLLPNGSVLLAGGATASQPAVQSKKATLPRKPFAVLQTAEVYDPVADTWTATGPMNSPRQSPAATLLPNGTVLLLGGSSDGTSAGALKSTEAYNPATNTWTPEADMGSARYKPDATLLPNGSVFVDGGSNAGPALAAVKTMAVTAVGPAESYDPNANAFTPEPSINGPHIGPAATLLPNGSVLEAGGQDANGSVLSTADEDDAVADTDAGSSMNSPRLSPAATLLPNGSALLAGGSSTGSGVAALAIGPTGALDSVETYDPASDTWTLSAPMQTPRESPDATLLPNGQVLVAGGVDADGNPLNSVETYDMGLGFPDSLRPTIGNVTISNGHSSLIAGDSLTLTGSGFTGRLLNQQAGSSGTAGPVVQIRSEANSETYFLPLSDWTGSTITTAPLPFDLPPGPAMVTVYANAIPSDAATILVGIEPDGVLAARIGYVKVASGPIAHSVTVTWAAERESNALGYDIYAAGSTTRLNAHIIPAHSVLHEADGLYSATVTLPAGVKAISLVDVEPGGKIQLHGPYTTGQTVGKVPSFAAPAATDTGHDPAVKGPSPQLRLAKTDVALSLAQDGIYHLTYETLTQQGVNFAGVNPARLDLLRDGKSVGAYVNTAKPGVFGKGDWLEFAATTVDTFYSGSSVYVLTARPDSKVTHLATPPSVSLAPKPGDPPAQSINRDLPGRVFYWEAAPAGDSPWTWTLLENDIAQYADQHVSFDLPRLYNTGVFANQQATVVLHLRGWGGYSNANPDHHAVADLGSVHGEVKFDGNAAATITLTVPASDLAQTGNNLRLRTPGDLGVQYDSMFLESISVSYPQATALPPSLTAIAGVRAFTRSSELRSDLSRQAGSKVQYVIVAHPDFVAGVAPLARLHRSENLSVATVDVNAIYDSYSAGVPDPAAIKAFIAYLSKERGLRYVLLAGADSTDPRGYVAKNAPSYIPAYRTPDSLGTLAPSDAPLADVNSDGLPDVALGRLPVRNASELAAMVSKIVAFQHANPVQLKATFASDPSSPTFAAIAHSEAASLPASTKSAFLSWQPGQPDQATAALVAQWKAGARLISYTGHSNADQWADDDFLDSSALQKLGGSTPALLTVWGCWVGNYDRPNITGLGQALLTMPNGGAAGLIASTTEVSADEYAPLSAAFSKALYAGKKAQRIGDALLQAKRSILAAHPGWQDTAQGVLLLGDPAARM